MLDFQKSGLSWVWADYVVFTTQLEKLSVEALEQAMKLVASAKRHGNPNLMMVGVVESMVPKPLTRLAQHFRKQIDDLLKDEEGVSLRFNVSLQRNVAIQEAATVKQTIFEYAPTHNVVEQYRILVAEIEKRISKLDQMKNFEGRAVANG